jgi:polysaccharide biosynthesis transport protein
MERRKKKMNMDNEYQSLSDNYGRDAAGFSLRDFLYIVFRYKWLLILFFIVVVGVGIPYVYYQPDIYQSTAKVLVKVGWKNTPEDMVVGQNAFDFMGTELDILRGRELAEQVVDVLGPQKIIAPYMTVENSGLIGRIKNKLGMDGNQDYQVEEDFGGVNMLREAAIATIMNNQEVTKRSRGNILHINYSCFDPRLAQEVLSTVLAQYRILHNETYEPDIPLEYYQKEAEKKKIVLDGKENEMRNFQKKHKIYSIDRQREALLDQVNTLQEGIRQATATIIGCNLKIAELDKSKKARPKDIKVVHTTPRQANPVADRLRSRLNELRQEEKKLSVRYFDADPPMVEVRDQITLVEKQLADELVIPSDPEVALEADPAYQELVKEVKDQKIVLKTLEAGRDALTEELKIKEVTLKNLNEVEGEMEGLRREVENLKVEYTSKLNDLEKSKRAVDLSQEKFDNVRIMQKAILPIGPIGPQKTRNYMVVLFLGLFGGAGLAIVFNYMNHTMKTPEDVHNKLGLPVLATFTYNDKYKKVI